MTLLADLRNIVSVGILIFWGLFMFDDPLEKLHFSGSLKLKKYQVSDAAGVCSGNAFDSYSGGSPFDSRPGHWLS